MPLQLDQKIEQLENIVEECLDRCDATQSVALRAMPANYEPLEYPLEFLQRLAGRK